MKVWKPISAALVFGTLYMSTIAFTPSVTPYALPGEDEDAKTILFETNDLQELYRVENLLSVKDISDLQMKAGLIKIRVTVKNRRQGIDIDLGGGN